MAFVKKERASEQGVALIMAMLVLTVMSIVIMGMATDADLDLKISRNLKLKNQAFNNAETGIALAAEVVRQSAMLNWVAEDSDASDLNLPNGYRLEIIKPDTGLGSLYNEKGIIDVYYEENGNENHIANLTIKALNEVSYSLESEGFEKNNSKSKIKALILPNEPFSAGMIGCEEIVFNGNAYSAETDVLSGGSISNTKNVTGDVNEHKEIVCDPLQLNEMFSVLDPNISHRDVEIPNKKTLESIDFLDGFYTANKLDIKGSLTIEGDLDEVNIYIKDDIEIDGEIIVEDGTQLNIYVEGYITITGNGKVNLGGDSDQLIFYSSNSNKDDVTVSIGGRPEFNGAIYAPYTNIQFSGTPQFNGAVRGISIVDDGNVNFTFDQLFQDWINSYPGGYYLSNWNSHPR